MVIEVNNLVKKYKDFTAVDGINLKVDDGEIFGLLGPNGAGKSTTLNALLGLLKIDSGTIKIFDKEFKRNAHDIKQNIGYVPQDFAFFETLSAIDNVTYWGKLYNLRGNDLKAAVKDALEFTGLWDRRKDKAKNFSGGMKRRLNIACAVVHKPKLLLMDEPTVGVDPQSRNNILESIKKLNKQGTTVIYTSHYMEEIEAICNRVAIMDFGKVIAVGTIDELIEQNAKEKNVCIHFNNQKDWMTDIVKKVEGVISVKADENDLHVKMGCDSKYFNELLECLVGNQIEVKSISSEKENLETVFLQLTGKKLRD